MQNCAEMERYLEKEQMTSSSQRKCSRSWTAFLSGVEQRRSSVPLQSATAAAAGRQQHEQLMPVSRFMLHRHCSTPSSPTASSSPFSLASPSSLCATTPDDDGTNPVDILCLLNIGSEPQSAGNSRGDVVSSSSSSTTSWDSARSDPDTPISVPLVRGAVKQQQQRDVRRPTELHLTLGAARHTALSSPSPCHCAATVDHSPRKLSNKTAACFKRIAKRRLRATARSADDVTESRGARSTSLSVVRQSPPARTRWPPAQSTHRLPPLPSPAEMAYLRSLSGGGLCSRTVELDAVATAVSTDSVGASRVMTTQRAAVTADRSGCVMPAAHSSTSSPPPPPPPSDNWRLAGSVQQSTLTTTCPPDPACSDAKKQLRLYGCSVLECGKLYSKSSHLKAHMRSHTGTHTHTHTHTHTC